MHADERKDHDGIPEGKVAVSCHDLVVDAEVIAGGEKRVMLSKFLIKFSLTSFTLRSSA